MREVDEQALRLDTALAFDEVRSLATMEERQRLAREIHDGVAQEIASLGYVVDDLTADRDQRHPAHASCTRCAASSPGWSASCGCRSSTCAARSPGAGSGSALSDYVREVGARSGLTVHLTLDEAPTRLRGEVETELLRIAQEAITNARKHSDAAQPLGRLPDPTRRSRGSASRTTAAAWARPRADSYGLKIMRERAERIGADARDQPRTTTVRTPRPGTSVTVTVGADEPATA